jgi:hypothetical protein
VPAPHRGGGQDEAKDAMSAMSPLKSCDVEKPQPQRRRIHQGAPTSDDPSKGRQAIA